MRYAVMVPTETGRAADPEWIAGFARHTLGHAVTKIDPDRAERLAAAGAERVVLAGSGSGDLSQVKDELSACAERLGLSAAQP